MSKRLFDLVFVSCTFLFFLIPGIIIAILIKITSAGPVLFWAQRVGKKNRLFWMPKFRTMSTSAPLTATLSLVNSDDYITDVGRFLRKYSLDEIPQIWSILIGNMSVVGPRPLLESEVDILALRSEQGVPSILPGLTGWAQINGRDFVSPEQKVTLDVYYMNNMSLWFDLKIVMITFLKVIKSKDVHV